MKVDTSWMEDAYFRLLELVYRLTTVEAQLKKVRYVLLDQELGSARETILRSLDSQIETVGRRKRSIKQLAQVLRSGSDQYQHCEDGSKRQAEISASIVARGVGLDALRNIRIIEAAKEKEVIDRYIMPCIVTGKKGTS